MPHYNLYNSPIKLRLLTPHHYIQTKPLSGFGSFPTEKIIGRLAQGRFSSVYTHVWATTTRGCMYMLLLCSTHLAIYTICNGEQAFQRYCKAFRTDTGTGRGSYNFHVNHYIHVAINILILNYFMLKISKKHSIPFVGLYMIL